MRYAAAAKALGGGSAWELARLPEPDRSFWLHRGMALARAEGEAMDLDRMDRETESFLNGGRR